LSSIKTYVKKPVNVQAIQYLDTAERITEISEFVGTTIRVDYSHLVPCMYVETPDKTVKAPLGSFIIKDTEG
jgi:hypothetical protein